MDDLCADFVRDRAGFLLVTLVVVVSVPVLELVTLPQVAAQLVSTAFTPRLLGLFLVLVAAVQVGALLRDRLIEIIQPAFEAYLKIELTDRFLAAERCGQALTSGDIIYLLTAVPHTANTWMTWLSEFLLPYGAAFVAAATLFWTLDRTLGLAFVAFILALVSVNLAAPQTCSAAARGHGGSMERVHDHLEDLVHNAETLASMGTRGREIAALRHHFDTCAFRQFRTATACARWHRALVVPLLGLLLAFFVVRGQRLVARGAVTRDAFVAAFLVLLGLLSNVFWITDNIPNVVLDYGQFQSANETLRRADGRPCDDAASSTVLAFRPPSPTEAVIGLVGVTFGYADRPPILQNVTLLFEAGARTALVGPVGAGKSTVLRLLVAFCRPRFGDAFLKGRWYRETGVDAVRRTVGYVPQQPVLFNRSLLFNVRYGVEDAVDEATARRVIHEYAPRLAARLHDSVGRGGSHLSGGQRQIVWCLRMLLRPPEVVLMDEPTASMDDATKQTLLVLLDRLMDHGRTVVVVTHDPFLLQRCNRTVTVG